MSNITIGWDKDLADAGSGTVGTNTMLNRLAAVEALRAAGTPIPHEEWSTLTNQLNAHMRSVGPEVFLDGPGGKYLSPFITAMGGDPAGITAVAFLPIVSSARTVSNSQVFTVAASVPAGVNVATVAWTVTAGTSATITAGADTLTPQITADAGIDGVTTLTCTVTDGAGATGVATVTITVA